MSDNIKIGDRGFVELIGVEMPVEFEVTKLYNYSGGTTQLYLVPLDKDNFSTCYICADKFYPNKNDIVTARLRKLSENIAVASKRTSEAEEILANAQRIEDKTRELFKKWQGWLS